MQERWFAVNRRSVASGDLEPGIDGVSGDDGNAFSDAMARNYLKPGQCLELCECDDTPMIRYARACRYARDVEIDFVKGFVDCAVRVSDG